MLTFLYLAAKRGLAVDRYTDEAVGTMVPNEAGVPWLSTITLNVLVQYRGHGGPSQEGEDTLHHEAHEQCFIANSIKSEVLIRRRDAGS
jgi:organic hydroperoxide reductase OsmC/OhrA